MLRSIMQVQTTADGAISRRGFLYGVGGAAGWLGLRNLLCAKAPKMRRQGQACILLFMRGGPSQFETFDPKPGTAHGGSTRAIPTAVSGIQVAQAWPKVAERMKDIALVRSLTNREGEHSRATFQLHTGYVPSGSVKYPSIGSIVASELADADLDLPAFVSIGNRASTIGSGFLGMQAAPFVVTDPTRLPANATLPPNVKSGRLHRRLDLLRDLEEDFKAEGGAARVADHQTLYAGAARLVLSPRLQTFDVSREPDAVRDRYGRTPFGQGCLLARRLVEQGVTFIEVESNGWDTHEDNFNRTKSLSEQVDPAFAALIGDLKDRGRLERTLVIWMGEFGRTPTINPRAGRDHFPQVSCVALAGAGIKGGTIVGKTAADGGSVSSRPVKVVDLFSTFYNALHIDPAKENRSPLGRPIKLVDGGAPIKEIVG